MYKALNEIKEERGGKKVRKVGWWDEKCRGKKKELRREMRRWRTEGGKDSKYMKLKKECREMCKRKKKDENEKREQRAKKVRSEIKVWEIINRERKG